MADILSSLRRRSFISSVTPLGGGYFRIVQEWDGTRADTGLCTGAHRCESVLRVDGRGVVVSCVTLAYTEEGVDYTEEQIVASNSYDFEEFPLDSYMGAVWFDAVFG